eukprot:GHVU01203417.1.p1 GENE.GHVU01203417.1~~GHVU01203417.1.p1  ORF type:complete len:256 (+),score=3.70 GHVU01203417.1:10-777(+)
MTGRRCYLMPASQPTPSLPLSLLLVPTSSLSLPRASAPGPPVFSRLHRSAAESVCVFVPSGGLDPKALRIVKKIYFPGTDKNTPDRVAASVCAVGQETAPIIAFRFAPDRHPECEELANAMRTWIRKNSKDPSLTSASVHHVTMFKHDPTAIRQWIEMEPNTTIDGGDQIYLLAGTGEHHPARHAFASLCSVHWLRSSCVLLLEFISIMHVHLREIRRLNAPHAARSSTDRWAPANRGRNCGSHMSPAVRYTLPA